MVDTREPLFSTIVGSTIIYHGLLIFALRSNKLGLKLTELPTKTLHRNRLNQITVHLKCQVHQKNPGPDSHLSNTKKGEVEVQDVGEQLGQSI